MMEAAWSVKHWDWDQLPPAAWLVCIISSWPAHYPSHVTGTKQPRIWRPPARCQCANGGPEAVGHLKAHDARKQR